MTESKLILTKDEFARLLQRAIDQTVDYVFSGVPGQRNATDKQLSELSARLKQAPEEKSSLDETLGVVLKASVFGRTPAHPGYLCLVNGGGLFQAMISNCVAAILNKLSGYSKASPGLVMLECQAIRWICDMFGYPKTSFGASLSLLAVADSALLGEGYFPSGGSLANLSAVTIARQEKLPANFLSGTMYTSDQAHHSVLRGAKLAGFSSMNIRTVPTNEDYTINVSALKEMIRKDRDTGMQPFLIVAFFGTVNTGAVDDMTALADVAKAENMWLHVDGAYGGFFILTEEGKRLARGLERADSITVDPHKSLFMPVGIGGLLVKDRATLERCYADVQSYMPAEMRLGGQSSAHATAASAAHKPEAKDVDPILADIADFAELSPEQTRVQRGLQVWMSIRLLGLGTMREALEERLKLAAYAESRIRELSGKEFSIKNSSVPWAIEVFTSRGLSVFTFRMRKATSPAASAPSDSDAKERTTDAASLLKQVKGKAQDSDEKTINTRLAALVCAKERAVIYTTVLRGVTVVRVIVLNFKTQRSTIDDMISDVVSSIAELSL